MQYADIYIHGNSPASVNVCSNIYCGAIIGKKSNCLSISEFSPAVNVYCVASSSVDVGV